MTTKQDHQECTELMPREDWDRLCSEIADAMKSHTRAFLAPLSTETPAEVRHIGTASFLCWNGHRVLLTCEHVSSPNSPIHFSLNGSEVVFPAKLPFVENKPLDAAFQLVSDSDWTAVRHQAAAIPSDRFAAEHRPFHWGEVFFFHGFAGENSGYALGTLESRASAYATQLSPGAQESDRIFELIWDPNRTSYTASTSAATRKAVQFTDAGGFSGSLVWNTRYIEVTHAEEKWTPDCAEVCGLLMRWDMSTKTLLATRIEHVRAWLDEQLA